ncbi:diheme cytochrome c [Aliarcobacter butzleri]|uniref:diheme cytochrome c n=1 Tax=Aliarcobacter butzleri TaxID=28197 RepID=UPI001ED9F3AE|nr:diheme cytochrome c [Aliarcobacter butzleri]MCG3691157.1 diheme cytochrome c [Aliarcobacter butzleri]
MADLENHFGDDASLDVQTNKNILDFLIKNSAENSSYKANWNFLNSINNQDIIALSQTSYWKRKHRKIPEKVFENPQVKSKANCKACHSDIEKGLIEYENIKDISTFN